MRRASRRGPATTMCRDRAQVRPPRPPPRHAVAGEVHPAGDRPVAEPRRTCWPSRSCLPPSTPRDEAVLTALACRFAQRPPAIAAAGPDFSVSSSRSSLPSPTSAYHPGVQVTALLSRPSSSPQAPAAVSLAVAWPARSPAFILLSRAHIFAGLSPPPSSARAPRSSIPISSRVARAASGGRFGFDGRFFQVSAAIPARRSACRRHIHRRRSAHAPSPVDSRHRAAGSPLAIAILRHGRSGSGAGTPIISANAASCQRQSRAIVDATVDRHRHPAGAGVFQEFLHGAGPQSFYTFYL